MSGRMKVLIGLLVFAILLFLANEIIPQVQQNKKEEQEFRDSLNATSEAIRILLDAEEFDIILAFYRGIATRGELINEANRILDKKRMNRWRREREEREWRKERENK